MQRHRSRLQDAQGNGRHVVLPHHSAIDPFLIALAELQASLTPSRANGFLNILRTMQAQARGLAPDEAAVAEDASPG